MSAITAKASRKMKKYAVLTREPRCFLGSFDFSWEQRKFSDVVATRRGLTYKPSDIRKNGVRVLRSSNIAEDSFVLSDEDVFVVREAVNIDCVRANDILITAANGSSRLVGKHTIISGIPEESAVHGGFMLLGTTKEPHFVNASMGSSWYRRFIELFVAGGNGAIGNLNKNDLDNQDIAIPSEKEQKKIGSFFRQLDNLITLHQRECISFTARAGRRILTANKKRNTSSWEQRKLEDYLTVSAEKNTGNIYGRSDVLSVSGDYGIVNQIEFQGRSFAGASVSNYGVVQTGDVVYTKSPLNSNPYGIIKTNKGKPGIVSTLYAVYHPKENAFSDFIQVYFEQHARMNNYMHPLVNKGAKNDMKVSAENALKGPVCFPSRIEQESISAFFSVLDNLITLHQRELEKLQNIKKSMLEKMFV